MFEKTYDYEYIPKRGGAITGDNNKTSNDQYYFHRQMRYSGDSIHTYYREYCEALEHLLVFVADEEGPDGTIQDHQIKKSKLLAQCDAALDRMATEARLIRENEDLKTEWMERIKVFRIQLSQYEIRTDDPTFENKNTYNNLKNTDENRNELFGTQESTTTTGGIGGGGGLADGQRLKSKAFADDMLSRQNRTLERARRAIQETEEVALGITEELGRNRDTIESTRSHVTEMQTLTNRANTLVKSLSKPWWQPRR